MPLLSTDLDWCGCNNPRWAIHQFWPKVLYSSIKGWFVNFLAGSICTFWLLLWNGKFYHLGTRCLISFNSEIPIYLASESFLSTKLGQKPNSSKVYLLKNELSDLFNVSDIQFRYVNTTQLFYDDDHLLRILKILLIYVSHLIYQFGISFSPTFFFMVKSFYDSDVT